MTIPKRYFTVVTAYVHVFVAHLKFVNREFLWDLSSLFLILRLMHFWFSCENIVACCWGYLLHSVKNSCEFADFFRHKTLNACEELLSFDVVSLFTKIPPDLDVKVAEERLREDASLGQRTEGYHSSAVFLPQSHAICIQRHLLSMAMEDVEQKGLGHFTG